MSWSRLMVAARKWHPHLVEPLEALRAAGVEFVRDMQDQWGLTRGNVPTEDWRRLLEPLRPRKVEVDFLKSQIDRTPHPWVAVLHQQLQHWRDRAQKGEQVAGNRPGDPDVRARLAEVYDGICSLTQVLAYTSDTAADFKRYHEEGIKALMRRRELLRGLTIEQGPAAARVEFEPEPGARAALVDLPPADPDPNGVPVFTESELIEYIGLGRWGDGAAGAAKGA